MEQSKDKQQNIASSADTQQIQLSKKIQATVKQAIASIGNQNKYQILLIVYFSFVFVFVCFILAGNSYFFMNPVFECDGKPATEEQACSNLDNCPIINSYTITAYAGLYCDQGTKYRQIIQSMIGIGAVIGVVIINAISDYRGRKFSFILTLILGLSSVSSLIIGAYTRTPFLMMISQLLGGFTANNLMSISYVLADKLMSKKWMNYTLLITSGCWAFGQMLLLIFTIGLNWQHLAIIFMLFPCLILLVVSVFMLVQDPVLLFTKKRFEECQKSIGKMARINKTEQKLAQSLSILAVLQDQDAKVNDIELQNSNQDLLASKLKYIGLLKNPIIFIPIICIGLFNLGANINYYVLNYSLSSTGNSYGISILFFGVAEFSGSFPMLYLNTRLPRKLGLISIVIIQIFIAAPFLFFDISPTLQTVLIVSIRFFANIQYALTIYLYVEIFPQHVQSTSIGFIDFIGQSGKFTAPFLVGLAQRLQTSPINIICFSLVIFGLITMIPIKQTLHRTKKQLVKDQSVDSQQTNAELLIN